MAPPPAASRAGAQALDEDGRGRRAAREDLDGQRAGLRLGFGHIVVLEMEAPHMLVTLMKGGWAVAQSDNAIGPYSRLGGARRGRAVGRHDVERVARAGEQLLA